MKRFAWVLTAVFVWLALAILPASADERQIARHQGLTASIDSNFGCARQASITVRAPNEDAYGGDRLALQRLIATVRAGLSAECPIVSEIDIMGLAAGTPAFQVTISAESGWVLPGSADSRMAARPPASPLAAKTSTCDYNPNDPMIGCWVIIAPSQWRGAILNIREDGSWFNDWPEKLADGSTQKIGTRIRRDYLYGFGPSLEMVDAQGWRVNRMGPFFAEECSIMRIDPAAAPLNTMLGMLTGEFPETVYHVRLRAPLRITADILKESDTGSGGLTGSPGDAEIVRGIPSDGSAPLFNRCPENFEDNSGDIINAVILAVPILRIERLLPFRIIGRRDVDRKIIAYKQNTIISSQQNPSTFFSGTSYTSKVQWQMQRSDYHAFPESVTAFAKNGKLSTVIGRDGTKRVKLEIDGEYKNRKGVFVFIKEPDGRINHRLFEPY